MFFCAGSLAGAFSGLLAYAIEKMDRTGGLAGWRWYEAPSDERSTETDGQCRIFILEGIFTALTGFAILFLMPNSPATASFLTAQERDLLCQRLESDSGGSGNVQTSERFQMKYLTAALTDWKIWLSVIVYWGNSISTYG
jgi:hypothetical protein